MTNTHPIDRFVRALLGVALLEIGFFWASGAWQWAAYAASLVMFTTALVNFCPIYRVLGLSSRSTATLPASRTKTVIAWAMLLAVLVGGSYGSYFVTKKAFLEDFNAMNDHYKQTLFLTGKNEREKANAKYALLVPALDGFVAKYTAYQPYALRGDTRLAADMESVTNMVAGVAEMVKTGDLHEAHLALEKVRPVFQELFKRNGFSMLAIALVDFHDAMELMLDAATAKDHTKLISLYPAVSDKLKAVEVEANDAEIQAIRQNLDALLAAAQAGKSDVTPAMGDKLKSSFVKVYLQRG